MSEEMDRWITLKEAAEYLSIHVNTMAKLIKTEGFPGHRIGKIWRFKRSEIDRWMIENDKTDAKQKRGRKPKTVILNENRQE